MSRKDTSILVAKASNLESLIDYQEDSVVSRTIVDRKARTITLFAFDEGQGLSEHTAPYEVMVYVINGEASITISRKSIFLKQGEMTIIPANQPHSLTAKTKLKMLLTMVKD